MRGKTFFTILFLLTVFSLSMVTGEEFTIGEPQNGVYLSEGIKDGTEFDFTLYVPNGYDPEKPAAIYVSHDGLMMPHAKAMESLTASGEAPVVVCVGLVSGRLLPTLEGGSPRSMRVEEYDQVGREYPDFLVDEFIPWLIETYHLNISPSPDWHLVGGASSGGISAWNIAWFRNDYFHRCYMSSPTFSAFRDGEELMYLVRITESKPIRAYEIYGRHEPNIYAGDSYIAALAGEDAMKFAGYPFESEYFPEGGHGVGYGDEDVSLRAFRYLWKGWADEPVKPLHNPDRVERLVEFGTAWEKTDEPFPESVPAQSAVGTYSFRGGEILLTTPEGETKTVSDGFGEITGLAVSTDGWRLYIADKARRFVFAAAIHPDGSLGKVYGLAPLRMATDPRSFGPTGIALDTKDRVYAATDLGIQGIISFGIVDSLLPLPDHQPADAVAFGGPDLSVLYVRSGENVYKRPMKTKGKPVDFPLTPPNTTSYFDGD